MEDQRKRSLRWVGDDDEHGKQEDYEAGRRKVKKLHDPKLLSETEVREHYCCGQVPYRSWCHHCVRGGGRERDRQRIDQEGLGIPEYHAMSSTGSPCWWRLRDT